MIDGVWESKAKEKSLMEGTHKRHRLCPSPIDGGLDVVLLLLHKTPVLPFGSENLNSPDQAPMLFWTSLVVDLIWVPIFLLSDPVNYIHTKKIVLSSTKVPIVLCSIILPHPPFLVSLFKVQ